MRALEKWIWLPTDRYPDQTTIYHPLAVSPDERALKGHYTVAEFQRTYRFDQKVVSATLRFSGDTAFDLYLNKQFVATGPALVGGDFLNNHICRGAHYASTVTLTPDSETLCFYARVKMMPVAINEYSKGRGGFMLTAHLLFADGSIRAVTTDGTWLARKNNAYIQPYSFDATQPQETYTYAQEIANVWHCEDAPIPVSVETLLYPDSGGSVTVPAGETVRARLEYTRVHGGFLSLSVQARGPLKVTVDCFELENSVGKEEFLFDGDTAYRGLHMLSVGGFRVTAENLSEHEANIRIGVIATHYPADECAITETSDQTLNAVLALCRHALKYCRQSIHLDSTLHCEPLACTGDYYIETLMTAFSYGDMRLAEFDVLRTAENLRFNDGRMFHTTYSLIFVLMAYDTYMLTGHQALLNEISDALILLLERFNGYMGENGLLEYAPDYMFVDWLDVDSISLHHPSKNLGQSCLNMYYYGALVKAADIMDIIGLSAQAAIYRARAASLKEAIHTHLFHADEGLYCEGLTTPTEEYLLNIHMPQTNGKLYFRKHANILAAYFGICDDNTARDILRRVMRDDSLGQLQPYFMHFLLEAVYRNGLREEFTAEILDGWKYSYASCPKGLQEGFIAPENYTFDLSHAWGGTPLYALPRALIGFDMVKPGFAEISLSPSLLGLDHATVEMLTPYGTLTVRQTKGEPPVINAPKEINITIR